MYGIETFVGFPEMNFGRTLVVSFQLLPFGGSNMWEKEEDIKVSVKNTKRHPIWIKVDLYEVCISYIIYCLKVGYESMSAFFSDDGKRELTSLVLYFRKSEPLGK